MEEIALHRVKEAGSLPVDQELGFGKIFTDHMFDSV